jgi:hypothetical protein
MGAPIQRLWHHISHWPFLRFADRHEPVLEPPEVKDAVAFRFKECDDRGPSAKKVEAKEHERAEQFKRDQLLPIMGMVLPR